MDGRDSCHVPGTGARSRERAEIALGAWHRNMQPEQMFLKNTWEVGGSYLGCSDWKIELTLCGVVLCCVPV